MNAATHLLLAHLLLHNASTSASAAAFEAAVVGVGANVPVAQDTLPGDSGNVEDLLSRLQRLNSIPIPFLSVALPAGALNTPLAFGASHRTVGIGFSYQQHTRYGSHPDGAIGAGIGLGDPVRAVGITAGISILDLRGKPPGNGGFGRRGSFTLKLHHVLPHSTAVAVGVENAMNWGGSDAPRSFFGVATRRFRLRTQSNRAFSRLYVSAGLGSGRYLPENDIFKHGVRANLFANGSLQVTQRAAALAEWTGQNFSLGASLIPSATHPFVVTVGVTDLSSISGSGPRIIAGGGWGFRI
jgi:hypothetical protein